nr:MAG TPA: capsid scaffolding protein [Caudoviricetes sp.]
MLKSELLNLLKDISDDTDINETILGIEDFKPSKFDIGKATVEDFKEMLNSNKEIKGYYTSTLDSKVSKGINTFKEKTLPSLVEEEIKKRSNEGLTEDQIKLKEMEAKIKQMEQDKIKAEMSSKYSKILGEKGLSSDLLDFVLGANDEITNANIEKINKIISSSVDTKVNEKIKGSSYTPPTPSQGGKITWGDVEKNPSLYGKWKKENEE